MERWERPSLIITAAMWVLALLLMPISGVIGVPPFFALLPSWMGLAGFLSLLALMAFVVGMMRKGEDRPISTIAGLDWRRATWVAGWTLIAGLHMAAFMSIKPQLNYLVPFTADPLLATIDASLFFGDPYRHLLWLNSAVTADYYHRGWFVGVVAVLLWQLCRAPGANKSANLLAYFLIWLSGPAIHSLLPAGGPIFFDELGYGARFELLTPPQEIQGIADYLWRTYSTREFALGAGISAMPSLHIATVAWVVMCCANTRWSWLAWPYAISIFLLSISLGWHYAVDGILGSIVAAAILFATRLYFRRLEWRSEATT